jgi:hypothetical protein
MVMLNGHGVNGDLNRSFLIYDDAKYGNVGFMILRNDF